MKSGVPRRFVECLRLVLPLMRTAPSQRGPQQMRIILLASAVCLFGSTNNGRAQVFDPALRGLTKLSLSVEQLNEDSQFCGITKTLIENAFTYPASAAKFEIVSDAHVPMALIVVTTLQSPLRRCISSIRFQVRATTMVRLDYAVASQVPGRVLIWEDGWLGLSERNEHAHQVSQTIEDMTKRLVGDWNLSNKATIQ